MMFRRTTMTTAGSSRPVASAALRILALIAISAFLVLVLFPAALGAAGPQVPMSV